MTITFSRPVSGDRFAPGHLVAAVSDFIGPLATGSRFEIKIVQAVSPFELAMVDEVYTTIASLAFLYGIGQFPQMQFPQGKAWLFDNADVTLSVELQSPALAVLDSGSIPIKYDAHVGPSYLIWFAARLGNPTYSTAGADLAAILAAVTRTFPPNT